MVFGYLLEEVRDLLSAAVGPGDGDRVVSEVRGHHVLGGAILDLAPVLWPVVVHAETERKEKKER